MPVYEYECTTCGGHFEVMQKFSDPAVAACKLCNAATVKKVLSPAAFVLKGSGWYATDYASGDRKKCGDSEKAEKPGGESVNKPKKEPGCTAGSCASGACPSKG